MKIGKTMDSYRLIHEVHKRPALWNQKHLSYHNRDITNRIWMEIAAIFKLPKQVLKTKWKGLRDTFRAEIKKETGFRKSKYRPNRRSWIHFDNLQFLKEQMLPRPPIWERNDNDPTSGASGADVTSEDSYHGSDAPEGGNDLEITFVEDRQKAWTDVTIEDKNQASGRRMFAVYRENVEILEDLADGSDETTLRPDAETNTEIPVDLINHELNLELQHSDSLSCNTNNDCNSCSISSINNQIEETSVVVKVEPPDNYDSNVDQFVNVEEEVNNVDNNDLVLEKVTTEEVVVGESSRDNSDIGSQNALDPLEVNRFDDNYYFLMSLLPHIRTLPAERRMLLRMQMQQLVYQEVYDKNRSSS